MTPMDPMGPEDPLDPGRRLYRAFLRLLPARLREKHGPAMEVLLDEDLRRARRRGRLHFLATLTAALADVAVRAAYERIRPGAPHLSPASAMDRITQDLRHAVRALARTPGFTAASLLILALAVGANTAVFSVVKGVILEPLPFPQAERVALLGMDYGGGPVSAMPHYRYEWLRERAGGSFEAMTVWRGFRGRAEVAGRPRSVTGLRVGAGFLETVGWPPARGRGFTAEELAPGGPPVALVSPAFAEDWLGVGEEALGRALRLGDEVLTVVGVLPEAFAFPQLSTPIDVLLPLAMRPDAQNEGQNYEAMVRLAPGAGRPEAQAELDAGWRAFRQAHAELVGDPERGPVLTDYAELYVGGLGTALWLILGAVGLILLIACANVANLLLARAASRRREMGIRAALGATRLRVIRLLVTESLVLTLTGGLLGVGVGRLSLELLLGMAPAQLPRVEAVALDGWVLSAALALMAVTGLVFGLVMALPGGRDGLARTLREGGRGSSASSRARRAMVLVQSAVAMVLLVGAGLLLGTLSELRSVDAGFDREGVVAVSFPLSPEGYGTQAELVELHRSFRAALAERGVAQAAQAFNLPLERGLNFPVAIAGRPEAFEGAVEIRGVSPSYFGLLGIELLQGRSFDQGDAAGAPTVAVVSRAFAEHWFPGESAVGQRVELGRFRGRYVVPELEGHSAEIVGVSDDVRDRSLRETPRRTLYLPVAQTPEPILGSPVFLVRAGPGVGAGRAIRDALAQVDPGLPEAQVRPMGQVVAVSLARERFNAVLLGTFAALAVALTAFGVFGVIAYDVRRRRREIGIRMALGARPGEVLRLMAAQGLWPVLAGLVLGAGAALWLGRVVQSLVWGVSPTDPTVFAVVAALLLTVTVLASWLPARQAARVDPVRSLGAE